MDNNEKWIAPILFGVAALSLFSISRMNQPISIPIGENLGEAAEFKALMEQSSEINRQLEKFLSIHQDEGIKIPDEYLDPYTLQLMEDPVMLSDNQTYNRHTALFLLKYKKDSPIANLPLVEGYLEDNTKLKECIESWLEALNLQYEKNFKIRL